MSEGMQPQPPPQPMPPPAGQPAPAGPPQESFQEKAQKLLNKVMPPVDPATDTPEAKIQRTLYVLIAVGLGIFVMCGFLYLVASIFT